MGIKNILKAKKILLLASGLNKAEAIRRLIEEEKNEDLPASALKDHPQTIIIVDQEAASLLKK
jgi:glucosamine-6-phosphate deaminase